MSSAEEEPQIDEEQRQVILDRYKKHLDHYAKDHKICSSDLGMIQIRDALVSAAVQHLPEQLGDNIAFGHAVVIADIRRRYIFMTKFSSAFTDRSNDEFIDYLKGSVTPTITDTAEWLYRRFRPKRGEPGYVRQKPGALVKKYQTALNHLADVVLTNAK